MHTFCHVCDMVFLWSFIVRSRILINPQSGILVKKDVFEVLLEILKKRLFAPSGFLTISRILLDAHIFPSVRHGVFIVFHSALLNPHKST